MSDNDIFCPNCNLKLIFTCPKCKSPTHLGPVSCEKCGYVLIKLCPICNTKNFSWSKKCRKCSYSFETDEKRRVIKSGSLKERLDKLSANSSKQEKENSSIKLKTKEETFTQKQITFKSQTNKQPQKAPSNKEAKMPQKISEFSGSTFLFYIDFINLDKIFEKYDKDEFKQKVIQNIKTNVKIAFDRECNFLNSHCVMFKLNYTKSINILEMVEQFDKEFLKFNEILEKTLDRGISYKFAITTIDEVRKTKEVNQLKFGSDKDIIVSDGAYSKLNNDLSLIKISPDSYKMVFLDQKPVFEQSEVHRYEKSLDMILNNISDSESKMKVIALNAPRGAGKTHLLNDLNFHLSKSEYRDYLTFYAQCSALTQISPYGLIQSFFVKFFECPNVLNDEFDIKEFEKNVLEKLGIEKLDEEKVETLANIIYPMKKDDFENILINKEITYNHLREVFDYLKRKKRLVLIIDDFDLIDESSYGFLKYLVEDDFFDTDAKIVLGYKNHHSPAMYFQTTKLNNQNCLNISLKTLNIKESRDFVKKVLRLEFLKENNIKDYILLNTASLLGDLIDDKILAPVLELSENEFRDSLLTLEKKGYLKLRREDKYGFRNSLIWSYCYIQAKEEPEVKKYVQLMLTHLNNKIISTPLICPILAQITGNKTLAFSLWTYSLRYSSYIGDVSLYTMAQKQCLILLENVKLDNLEYTKNNICERLGKLIYTKNPQEAKDYLTNVIVSFQKEDKNKTQEQINYAVNKIIDISGYLVKSTYLTQDYTGCIEIVDNVLKYFNLKDAQDKKYVHELKTTLIKTRKLEALLQLGSWEELASLVNSEINPVLQKNLNIFSKHKWISQSEIFYAWIEANIILAQSYSQQGSPLAIELISEIEKVLSKEKGVRSELLKIRLAYANAMAKTSKGNFDESDAILQDIVTDFSYVIDAPKMVCEWNIISLINKILRYDFDTIKDELFEATAYANNSNDEVSKNILKTLLAYVFLEEKSYLKALEIATEQMQYFSSKKIAFGALLSWYISAASTAYNKTDMYCIEICEKAVKICENAQNNNSYFKILFQELLSKVYLKLNDKENAGMYCEQALNCANENELLYLQARLTWLKTTIARENLSIQPDNKKVEYAKNVIKMYNKSIELCQRLNLVNIIKKIEKELTSFRAHCQLNRILEDK